MNAPPAYAELVAAWRRTARARGFALEEREVGEPRRTLLSARIAGPGPTVFLAAGAHGDEPAPPWALLDVVASGLLDPAFGYRVWCCTNPTGYARGTRRNVEDVDVNRSYADAPTSVEARAILAADAGERYALAIDLHEDFEAEGVYLYEPLVDVEAPLGRPVLDATVAAGYPLQRFTAAFDLGYAEDGSADELRRLEPGLVIPDVARECAHFAGGLPLTLHLLEARRAVRTLTFESPRRYPWEDRMALHRVAVVEALAALRRLGA